MLHRAEQLAADRFAQLVGGALTLRQFAVLAAVAELSGRSQIELVRATRIDRSTLADLLRRLQRRGWLTRTASDLDRRAYSVRLTPDGAAILLASTQHARAADAAILDLLPRAKRKAFMNTLLRLCELSDKRAARAEREARRLAKREARQKRRAKTRGGARAKRNGPRKHA
jgi:DNA-binding MarR family transcriptional regulator